jgi:hypothetical protein
MQNAGAVYIFNALTGEQIGKFAAPSAVMNSDFGWSVDLQGTQAVIGSSGGLSYLASNVFVPEPGSLVTLFAAVGGCCYRRRR